MTMLVHTMWQCPCVTRVRVCTHVCAHVCARVCVHVCACESDYSIKHPLRTLHQAINMSYLIYAI